MHECSYVGHLFQYKTRLLVLLVGVVTWGEWMRLPPFYLLSVEGVGCGSGGGDHIVLLLLFLWLLFSLPFVVWLLAGGVYGGVWLWLKWWWWWGWGGRAGPVGLVGGVVRGRHALLRHRILPHLLPLKHIKERNI